ncbi:hypothetical protein FJT64_022523 [Amphibalanus amphitrite]|uniref:Kielin/chordin-like protein n=1 Tax=Amphibalanus amphitrite TaxID=1232801 RepID=A0A6A4WIH7_AMPAM|nr:hypothetical protein FJT64_022523 [Amphibalanus amphitrite]
MAPSFVCLVALVAAAAAYAPPEPAAYAPPEPARCYSEHLSKHFNIGDKWTEAGCQQAECVDGQASLTPCAPVATADASLPSARCRQVDGAVDGQYPACCPTAVCDQCYSQELDTVFDDGAVWTEAGCTQVTCDKGRVASVTCPLVKLAAGCRLEEGDATGAYPSCCPQPVCPRPDQCYSTELDQVFDDGAVWTESDCTQVTCQAGEPVRVPCAAVAAEPGCEVREGTAGGQYPTCCPQSYCPTTTAPPPPPPAKYY